MISLSDLNISQMSPQELGELLMEAKKAYYTTGKPIMDDATYDTLEDILRQKNPYHRIFQKVGNRNFDTGFDKKRHVMPMGSQNKVKSYPELVRYFQLKKIPDSTEFIVQPKIDGLSLEIEYKEGRVVDAITRGDGIVGDVITQNTIRMQNFQEILKSNLTGSVRCEIVVTFNDFTKLNQSSEEKYSNPRNAASGISQRLDGKFSEYCTLLAVDLYAPDLNLSTENEKIEYLNNTGLNTVETICCPTLNEVEKIYSRFTQGDRENYPYELDGLVIKINDLKLQQSLGIKDNRPKSQVAYKFPSRTSETRLLTVVWQTGPYGLVTPVAQVEPIEVSGAIINYASLSNYELIKEMGLNVGDVVEISRRGDVIPHIERVVTKVAPGILEAPSLCPVCQSPLITDNKFLRCPNTQECLAQSLGTLRIFCATLDIKGISSKTIEKLVKAKKLSLPGDFYKLTVNDFVSLDGLGEKSGSNIIREIKAKQKLTLKETFDAAAIPNFSAARIQQVIDAGFDTPEKILALDVTDLEPIPGFQTVLATKIVTGIRQRLDSINSILSQITLVNENKTDLLQGKSFAITGDLSQPRKAIEEMIIKSGGKIASSVTGNTDYLVTNETESTSSKFQNAKKLNIPIISEERLYSMLGQKPQSSPPSENHQQNLF